MKEKKNEAGQDPLTSPESGTVRDKHFRKYNLWHYCTKAPKNTFSRAIFFS